VDREIRETPTVVVDPFSIEDRALVRDLCCDAAWEGRPLEEWLPIPHSLFADLFTSYYTDQEPQSSFVARVDGEFAGYVLTCLNSRSYEQAWRLKVLLPAALRIITGRHRIGVGAVIPLLHLGLAYLKCNPSKVPLSKYPGHLHINIVDRYRRWPQVSRALLHRAIDHFLQNDVTGIHGIVMTSRNRMEGKYRRWGFSILARCPSPRPSPDGVSESYWLTIAMDLSSLPESPFSFRTPERHRRSPLAITRPD